MAVCSCSLGFGAETLIRLLTWAPLTTALATGPPSSPSSTSQSNISPTRAARIGQREFLVAFGHSMRDSLSRQQARYWCHPPEFGQHDPVSITVRSCSNPPHSVRWIRVKRVCDNGKSLR